VRELVHQQPAPGRGVRREPAFAEDDVRSHRIGERSYGARRFRGARARVQAHSIQIPAHSRFEIGLQCRIERLAGIPIVGLEWPGVDASDNRRRPWLAWRQALGITRRLIGARLWSRPFVVISHAPPTGVGDAPDRYHVGFDAYRWLLHRLAPPIWLHGHTTTASVSQLVERSGRTVVANATGAVLLELIPPAATGAASAA